MFFLCFFCLFLSSLDSLLSLLFRFLNSFRVLQATEGNYSVELGLELFHLRRIPRNLAQCVLIHLLSGRYKGLRGCPACPSLIQRFGQHCHLILQGS